jgi:GNAT superfamily N-acetyltransferase
MITTRLATADDIEQVVPLFDAYRQFYGQPSHHALASRFLSDRFARGDSTILVACEERGLVGFTQLYPSYSSTRAARILILNDLYVEPSHRRAGVGRALLQEAVCFARMLGAIRLTLSTAHTNTSAQRLYESMGWKIDEQFRTYTLATVA